MKIPFQGLRRDRHSHTDLYRAKEAQLRRGRHLSGRFRLPPASSSTLRPLVAMTENLRLRRSGISSATRASSSLRSLNSLSSSANPRTWTYWQPNSTNSLRVPATSAADLVLEMSGSVFRVRRAVVQALR